MANHRNDKRGSQRSNGGGKAPAGFEGPSSFSRRPEDAHESPLDVVEVTVLWFNVSKGFGFVQPEEGEKAFIHLRQLEAAGVSRIGEGAALRVVLQHGEKGPSVSKVIEVISAGQTAPAAKRPFDQHHLSMGEPLQKASGVVKWFNAKKGFGFIGRTDGGKDIFVHASALRGSRLNELREGQAVIVQFAQGPKGPEAKSLKIGDDQTWGGG